MRAVTICLPTAADVHLTTSSSQGETLDSIEVDQPAIDALVSPPKPHPAVPSRCVFEKIGDAYPGPRSGHQRCRLFVEASSLFDGMGAKNRRWYPSKGYLGYPERYPQIPRLSQYVPGRMRN